MFIDLDTMINGDLAPFFDGKGTFQAIGPKSWTKRRAKHPAVYRWLKPKIRALEHKLGLAPPPLPSTGKHMVIAPTNMGTGIFAFDIGAHTDIVDALCSDIPRALRLYRNEQHFVQNHLKDWQGWPYKTICSVKYHLRRPIWQSFFRHPMPPPSWAPIVAFHGDPRPMDMAMNRVSRLREFPNMWMGRVAWFCDYWDKHSAGPNIEVDGHSKVN